MKGYYSKAVYVVALLSGLYGYAAGPRYSTLAKSFLHPPESARPWVFWFWLNGNITSNGITADLEAMQRAGIGGVAIMDVDQGVPKGPVDFGTEAWFNLFRHMCSEAHRLGLQVNMNNDAGWSGSGGPWITPELSMQKLVWTETQIKGPRHFSGTLPQPLAVRDYYRDVMVCAVPASDAEATTMRDLNPKITVNLAREGDPAKLIDHDPKTMLIFPRPGPGQHPSIQFEFSQPYTARRLLMTLPGISAHKMCHGQLEISNDGSTFRTVREFDAEAPAFSLNFDEVSTRYFRILFTGAEVYMEHLDIAEIELSGLFRIPNIEEKALFAPKKEAPPRTGEVHFPEKLAVPHDRIVNLTSRMRSDGQMDWDVPEGNWTVLRFGHTSTGEDNQPSPELGRGLECDKFSKDAAEAMFNGLMGRLISAVGPLAGKTLAATHIDSWEVGAQNWTGKFADEFKTRRGYDPLPLLPVMTGRVVDSLEVSERFLWDLRQTVSDLIVDNYAGHFRELAHRNGMRLTIEAYDLSPCEDLRYASRADEPMAEFWTWPPYAVAYSCIEMASAAHVYGKPIVGCEAFTATAAEKWLGHPFAVKVFGDWAFCHGINHFVLHRYAHQPWVNPERAPGMSMGPWGLHYERTQTWWKQIQPWHEYLSRCQYLLQQGLFVADICYLAPEESPQRWQPPDRSKERPGYNYDGCPPEVVLKNMSVKDGRLVLPDGMNYQLLVMPDSRTMTPQLLRKIRQLVEMGATVVGPPPTKSPSLFDFPHCDSEVTALAREIWGDCDGKTITQHQFGKGKAVWGPAPQQVLAGNGVPPDFIAQTASPTQLIRYTHRSLGNLDIYFLANRSTRPVDALNMFRIHNNRRPELWWPDTGRIERPAVYSQTETSTRLPLHFDPNGSVFVIFPAESSVERDRIVSVQRNGETLVDTAVKPWPIPGVRTNGDLSGTFTMMAWVKPSVEIDLPEEANEGSGGLQDYRNDALYPPPGHDLFEAPNQAGSGLSVGRNGVCVYEHSDNYFAPPLVYGAPLTNWAQVAVVYRQNKPSLYLNGKPVHEGLQSKLNVHCGVGLVHRRGVGPFWGELGDFETFDHALTDSEIEAAKNRTTPPSPARKMAPIQLTYLGNSRVEAEIGEAGIYKARSAAGESHLLNAADLPSVTELSGPWEVAFAPGSGAPSGVTFNHLISWSEHSDAAIKYFSGTARYRKQFDVPAAYVRKDQRVYLNLGEVDIMARVKVNSKDLGIYWKPPFQVEITSIVKATGNDLEIEVVNLWANRMIGDEQLPEDSERTAKGTLERWPAWLERGEPNPTGRFSFTSWRLWKKNSSLRQSGLIGPVQIRATRLIAFRE